MQQALLRNQAEEALSFQAVALGCFAGDINSLPGGAEFKSKLPFPLANRRSSRYSRFSPRVERAPNKKCPSRNQPVPPSV